MCKWKNRKCFTGYYLTFPLPRRSNAGAAAFKIHQFKKLKSMSHFHLIV